MVRHARRALRSDTAVRIASVATAFPSGQVPLKTRLAEVRAAVGDGADEIDMVINRGAFLAGDFARVQEEIAAVLAACGDATLKVILEVSELETFDNIRAASFLAMRVLRPGDFIKTSTGKTTLNATLGNNQVMLDAIRHETRRRHPHGEAGAAFPRRREGDARRCVAEQRALPLRRERAAQRPPPADRKGAHRELSGPVLFQRGGRVLLTAEWKAGREFRGDRRGFAPPFTAH
jgi:hypothetical protein